MVDKIVRPPTLTTAVANRIREAIMRAEILPGEPLREVELSKSLQVSRGTLREALHQLIEEGLIEGEPYRGAFVSRLTPQKAKEIYTLRSLLESYAVRLGMEQGAYSSQDLTRLKELVEEVQQQEEKGKVYEALQADAEFHALLSGKSGHELLNQTLKNLRSLSMLFILNTKLYGTDIPHEEITHQTILEAIKTGDPSLGEARVREHITNAGQALVKLMETPVQT